ncbi:unnamed protein product [Chironomus riparius]|nr:unnamed protein product [Chironomus riparius]
MDAELGSSTKYLKMNMEECTEKFFAWESLKSIIDNNIDFLKCDQSSYLTLHDALLGITNQLNDARILYEEIESFCKKYDVDENIQANGYRSFLKIFDSAINHAFKTLKHYTENRSKLFFRRNHYIKEIEACHQLLGALKASFKQLISLHLSSEDGNLFPTKEFTITDVFKQASEINQTAFYGRCFGFQFHDSIRNILKFISIIMASYSESYYSNNGKFVKTSNSIYNSGRYYFDPEMLARRLVDLSQNASVDFCKNFWCLAESEIIHSIPFVNYSVKVNHLLKINPNTLKIPKVNCDGFIEIQSPGIIQARLISSFKRVGMLGEKDVKSSSVLPKSKEILFHCHGGGFVAQSSASHLVYLLEWAVNLNIPIISIDYSLAPEYPFPRAANEIFYAYCWALQNCELLGSTCERIVLCGDSAGANLCLSTLVKSISMNIRKPDGIFIAYCPILVSFDPSPSRLLCLQDPLIPFGFMIRCLKAYILQNGTKSDNNNNKDLNNENERDLLISDFENDEISGSSNKSDSFEEISCFECHQTDSDIKAHISQVSTASNDTLQSLPTVTEKYKDTLEYDSPVDSINSTISLEKDPFDGEVKMVTSKTTMMIPSTSETQYVDNFIEKYTIEEKLRNCSNIRKVSRTRSEENIIIDVSKETLCVRNIHRRFQFAASSFRRCFSSTFGGFTRNNHTIINLFEEEEEIKSKTSIKAVEDFSFTVPKDPLLSPFYASDEILKEFPPIKILSLTLDSCLDDSVMFAKRLKSLNVNFTLDVLDKLPHGFLNFSRLSKEAHEGCKLSMVRIAELLDLKLDLATSFCHNNENTV